MMLDRLSTRSRIIWLVVASALPVIVLSVYVALEQRASAGIRAREAIQQVNGPVILVTNLLTEGRGMWDFTAGDAFLPQCCSLTLWRLRRACAWKSLNHPPVNPDDLIRLTQGDSAHRSGVGGKARRTGR